MDQAVVSVERAGKFFGSHRAVWDLDMKIHPGRITVLLGPNGAGKTTAIRMITGALAPDTGAISVFGNNPLEYGEEIRTKCGVVSANPALYERLTGWDNLIYASELYRVKGDSGAKIREAAQRFGIDHALDDLVGGYSTGMKTRLALARSILHEPELLLFDEPTSGLDPESAQEVLRLIREMTTVGTSILMCTHHLAEAEGLADEVVMLEAGQCMMSGNPTKLAAEFWPESKVEIRIGNAIDTASIADAPGVQLVESVGTKLTLTVVDHEVIPSVVKHLVDKGVQVVAVKPIVHTLEDLYFETRRRRREGAKNLPPAPTTQEMAAAK